VDVLHAHLLSTAAHLFEVRNLEEEVLLHNTGDVIHHGRDIFGVDVLEHIRAEACVEALVAVRDRGETTLPEAWSLAASLAPHLRCHLDGLQRDIDARGIEA